MPERSDKEFATAVARLAESYIYDFLYYDSKRIGSFQAQLGTHGTLKNVKHHAGSGEESSNSGSLKAEGGVPAVANASAASEEKSSLKWDEALDQEFDPFWVEGLKLFEDLDGRNLVHRDVSSVGIGTFVLLSGELLIIDTAGAKPGQAVPEIKTHTLEMMTDALMKGGSSIVLFGEAPFASLVGAEKREERAEMPNYL